MGQSIQQYSLLSVLTVCRNEYVKTFLKLGQLDNFKIIVWGSHTQVSREIKPENVCVEGQMLSGYFHATGKS